LLRAISDNSPAIRAAASLSAAQHPTLHGVVNVKLYPLPSEIVEKVPQARSHKFFVKDDDTIILVSPSDRRIKRNYFQ
jgi:hypothetical protein